VPEVRAHQKANACWPASSHYVEGRPTGILAYVDRALLFDLWDELALPRAVRTRRMGCDDPSFRGPFAERSQRASAWCGEMAGRLADLDVEVSLVPAGRINLQLHGVGDGGPFCRQRAIHDGADLGLEACGADHFRNGLVLLPGERGGYLGLNGVPGNRRCSADADMGAGAAATDEPASGRHGNDGGYNVPFPFWHVITPK